jgi:small-conductance mechanosensitive channel
MEIVFEVLPSVGTIVAVLLTLVVVRRLLDRSESKISGRHFQSQVIMILLTGAGLVIVILVIPMSDTMRGQVLGLLGILVSASIALSSTTIIGNAMAGVMMRAVRNFRMGDFIRVGEHFGRVSERGLFHTEIQTEDRELTTLPNIYLVSNPVTTIRKSGTIVSAVVSLGYDLERTRVEGLLLEAAKSSDLEEPFVSVLELGDFAVTYRVAGLLTEVKRLISTRSQLRKRVMDSLHGDGVEIVSPSFRNMRALSPETVFVPRAPGPKKETEPDSVPEDVVFDKAEEAESLEELRLAYTNLAELIETAEEGVKQAPEGEEREKAGTHLSMLQARKDRLAAIIADRESKTAEDE